MDQVEVVEQAGGEPGRRRLTQVLVTSRPGQARRRVGGGPLACGRVTAGPATEAGGNPTASSRSGGWRATRNSTAPRSTAASSGRWVASART